MDVDIQRQLFLSCLYHGAPVVPISVRRAFGFELVNTADGIARSADCVDAQSAVGSAGVKRWGPRPQSS